jgi:hypothetical protein
MVTLADLQNLINLRRSVVGGDFVLPADQDSDKAIFQAIHDLLGGGGGGGAFTTRTDIIDSSTPLNTDILLQSGVHEALWHVQPRVGVLNTINFNLLMSMTVGSPYQLLHVTSDSVEASLSNLISGLTSGTGPQFPVYPYQVSLQVSLNNLVGGEIIDVTLAYI